MRLVRFGLVLGHQGPDNTLGRVSAVVLRRSVARGFHLVALGVDSGGMGKRVGVSDVVVRSTGTRMAGVVWPCVSSHVQRYKGSEGDAPDFVIGLSSVTCVPREAAVCQDPSPCRR